MVVAIAVPLSAGLLGGILHLRWWRRGRITRIRDFIGAGFGLALIELAWALALRGAAPVHVASAAAPVLACYDDGLALLGMLMATEQRPQAAPRATEPREKRFLTVVDTAADWRWGYGPDFALP